MRVVEYIITLCLIFAIFMMLCWWDTYFNNARWSTPMWIKPDCEYPLERGWKLIKNL